MIAYAPQERGSTVTATQEIGWIDNDAALARLVAVLATTSIAAVDTEFVREKTYYPQLCLIQIGAGEQVACVDCLAQLDLEPLYARLFDPSFTWVLHSARQDLEVIFQRAGRMPPRLIDTQVAAAFTGYPPQVGLEGLLEAHARCRARRELRPHRLEPPAAAGRRACVTRSTTSATCLPRGQRLDAELDRLGRREWLREDCERMLAEQPVADTTAVWSRLKGVHGLPFASQCAALALVRWREAAAQRSDRPRRWLLADEVLIAIAATLPRDADALDAIAQSKFIARSAPAVLAALASRNDAGAASRGARERSAESRPTRRPSKACKSACASVPPCSAWNPRSSRRGATSSASRSASRPTHLRTRLARQRAGLCLEPTTEVAESTTPTLPGPP